MTAISDLLKAADRRRLLERIGELADLDRMMRERGTLAEPDEPPPLHRSRGKTNVSTANVVTESTAT